MGFPSDIDAIREFDAQVEQIYASRDCATRVESDEKRNLLGRCVSPSFC